MGIYRLSNEVAKRGHKVDIIHCKDAYLSLNPKGPTGHFPNHPNITVHGLKSKLGFVSPLLTQQTGYPFLKSKKIENILSQKKFDIIHYHNISLVGGPKLLKKRKEITLYTTHEHWLVCPMHVLWKFNRELCKKRSCFLCSIVWKRPPQLWRYTRMLEKSLRNVDYFISPSMFTIKKHHELGLKIPFVHMPYFLPLSEENSYENYKDDEQKPHKPYFLFVGRLEKIKGVQNLIPVFKNYSGAELLIAGDGEFGETLKSLAKGNDNVRFLGRTNHCELRKLYKNALAVIVPSICYEVFGIIIIESFSMKTPVIVNDVSAPTDVVQESGGGYVYNNEKELIAVLDILGTRPEVRKELGEKGYNAYRKYWTEDNCMRIYFDLIHKIAQKKKINVLTEDELVKVSVS
ncbi:MAG: glycosyltransferase family 4 protein [Candidatus Scalindua sp.]|nr:glycosyltransferase family 4 protein [Candidatus Scalindua sp.]